MSDKRGIIELNGSSPTGAVIPILAALIVLMSLTGTAAVAESLRYSCRPLVPHFCGNIHIGCVNPTDIATVPMVIEVRQAAALVWFGNREQPVQARVSRDDAMVIRPIDGRDWIRIRPDLQFAQRIYRKRLTAMAYGICKTVSDTGASKSD